jgi:hypothetical protein
LQKLCSQRSNRARRRRHIGGNAVLPLTLEPGHAFMGGFWSVQGTVKEPKVEEITAYPFADVEFIAPLSIALRLSRDALTGIAETTGLVKWTVYLEVDVAHMQSTHPMLTMPASSLSDQVNLYIPASAFAEVSRMHSPDQLANIGVLHVSGSLNAKRIVDCAVVVDVFMGEEKQLRRRLYGVLPGEPDSCASNAQASSGA